MTTNHAALRLVVLVCGIERMIASYDILAALHGGRGARLLLFPFLLLLSPLHALTVLSVSISGNEEIDRHTVTLQYTSTNYEVRVQYLV